MRRLKTTLLWAGVLVVGCSADGGLGSSAVSSADPYAPGKADGTADFFDEGQVYELELNRLADPRVLFELGADGVSEELDSSDSRARLRVTGRDLNGNEARARYKHFEVRGERGGILRVQLQDGDRLAGMKTFRFVPVADADTALRSYVAARLLDDLDVAVRRVAVGRLFVDGADHGLHLIEENAGNRFLSRHFDDDEGVFDDDFDDDFDDEDAPEAMLLAQRQDSGLGSRALAATFDMSALRNMFAGAFVIGQQPEFRLYDVCGVPEVCFAPVVHTAPMRGIEPLDLVALRDDPRLDAIARSRKQREEFVEAIADAAEEALDLVREVREHAQSLGVDAEPLVADIHAAAERVAAWVDLEERYDAPDGDESYAPFVVNDSGVSIRFRHLVPGAHAVEVSAMLEGGRQVPMAFDDELNLWVGTLPDDAATEYSFEVRYADDSVQRVDDPVNRLTRRGNSFVDPAEVDVLTLIDVADVPVPEPSGLVFADGLLFVVGDRRETVYGLDPLTLEIVSELDLGDDDAEGLTFDALHGHLIVALEAESRLVHISFEGEIVDRERVDWAEDGNSGLEGVTIRPEDGHMFLVKEKDPVKIAELDADGDRAHTERIDFADDLSDIFWDSEAELLYVLSDEEQMLYRLDDDFDVTASWELDVERPEGITIRNGVVYIVSDDDSKLHRYTLDVWSR